MELRRVEDADAVAVSELIRKTIRISNIKMVSVNQTKNI